MTDKMTCYKEGEIGDVRSDIKLLTRGYEDAQKQISKLDRRCEDMSTMSTAISVMSVSLEHIVEHNHRQDGMMSKHLETLEQMSDNIIQLNEGKAQLDNKYQSLKLKYADLEERVSSNEDLNKIDLRVLNKDAQEGVLKKWGLPVGIGAGLALLAVEMLRAFI